MGGTTAAFWQSFRQLTLLLLIGSLASPAMADAPYVEAPDNTVVRYDERSPESQTVAAKYQEFQATGDGAFAEEIRALQESDYVNMDNLSRRDYQASLANFQQNKLVIVDSVVGNATRLGNPVGGKGAVEIGQGITFMDSKVIRLALTAKATGAAPRYILWCSPENQQKITELLSTLPERLAAMPLNEVTKQAVRDYLTKPENINLMMKAELKPVIADATGELTTAQLRNRGAAEMVPVMHQSGLVEKLGITRTDTVLFSNIDNDINFFRVLAAAEKARRQSGGFDVLQLHTLSPGSGGSVFWVKQGGRERMVPLEAIEAGGVEGASLNTNTVLLTGEALDPAKYEELNIPFEKKTYEKAYKDIPESAFRALGLDPAEARANPNKMVEYSVWLPKMSLSDIGKHPDVKTVALLGNPEHDFYTGSKDTEKLAATGAAEIARRLNQWRALSEISLQEAIALGISLDGEPEEFLKTCL